MTKLWGKNKFESAMIFFFENMLKLGLQQVVTVFDGVLIFE